MTKLPTKTRTRKKPLSGARPKTRHEREVATALDTLSHLEPETSQATALIGLLQSWLADASGYDEETWPELKQALDVQRATVSARRLFHE